MSDVGGAGDVQVSAVADEQSLLALTRAVENAIGKGFEKGFQGLGAGLNRQTKAISTSIETAMGAGFKAGFADLEKIISRAVNGRGFKNLEGAIKDAFSGGNAKGFLSDMSKVDSAVLSLTARLKLLDSAVSVQSAAVRSAGEQTVRAATNANSALRFLHEKELAASKAADKERIISLNSANQERLILTKQAGAAELTAQRSALDAVGREQKQAGELAVVAARNSGRLRVAAARAAFEGILAVEKGLGTAISGIARTATSAVSRLFAGMKQTVTREVRETNNSFTHGLSTSLTERESILRDSFRDQERIIRTSVNRQEAQINRLRTIGSTGVAGAVTGRGIGLGIGGLIAGAGIGQLISGAFKDSTNLTEQLSKNEILFGQYARSVVDFSKTSVTALGVTQAEALQSTGVFGNLFKGFGEGAEEAAKKSVVFTQLATDLASFGNTSVDEAFTALSAGLVGESEPLKRFGVVLNDATLKAKALELGLYSGKGVLDTYAKSQAAYAIILEKTVDAQGNFALTARDGANAQKTASASIRQFLSTVVGLTKGITTAIANGIIPIFTTLTNLVTGENLSSAMLVFRDAVKGVAIALAGILAAKAAVQVFQLIGLAVSAALTPMGALVLVAAAVGAALGILLPRSEALRTALSNGIEAVKGYAESVRDFLVPILEKVATFVVEVGIPAFLRLADTVRDYLVKGFGIAARFITGTVVPALQTAFVATAGFITDTALPAIRSFIDYLGDEVAPKLLIAAEAVQRFFGRVRDAVGDSGLAAIAAGLAGLALGGPVIAAAAAGLAYIGTKIVESFDGFSNLPSTALDVLKNIGADILRVLEPVRKTVVTFFKDLFSLDTLGTIGEGILTAIEFVGRKLGELLSSKTFVRTITLAAAGIVTAAVLVGAAFLKGFAEGVVKNAPETLRYIRDAIIDGLKLLLDPTAIGAILIAAFALTQVIGPIIRSFKKFGADAGDSFTGAFKSRISGGRGFLQGALGGIGAVDAANQKAGNKSLLKEFQAVNNELRIMGSTKVGTLGFEAARAEADRLRAGISDAQYAGLKLRDSANLGAIAIKTGFAGASGVLRGLGQSLGALGTAALTPFSSGEFKSKFTGGLTQMKNSFKATMGELALIAREQGTKIGKVFGAGMAVAIGGALAGFVGGKAEGKAGGSGGVSALATALGTGLLVTQATGGNVVAGAAAAAVAGSVSLIGTEMGKAERAAAIFAEGVSDAASVLKGAFADGLDAGIDGVISLTEAFTNVEVGKSILEGFTPATLKVLKEAGISIAEIQTAFAGGDTTAKALFDQLGSVDVAGGFSKTEAAILELNAAFAETRGGIDAVNDAAAVAGKTIRDRLGPEALAALTGAAAASGLIPQTPRLSNPTTFDRSARDFEPVIPVPKIDASHITVAAGAVDKALEGLATQAATTNQKIQELFNPPVANQNLFTQIDQSVIAISGLGVQIQEQAAIAAAAAGTGAATVAEATRNELERQFGAEFAAVIQAGIASGVVIDSATGEFVTRPLLDAILEGVTDESVKQGIIDTFNAGIAGIPPLISETNATNAAVTAQSAIQTYFTNNPIDPELATTQSLEDYATAAATFFTENPITPGVEADTEAAAIAAGDLIATMLSTMDNSGSSNYIAEQIAQGLIDGLKAKEAAVNAAAASLALSLINSMAGAADVQSPSRKTIEIGQYIGDGLVIGMQNRADAIGFSAASLGEVIGFEISAALVESTDGISAIMTGIIDSVFDSGTTAAMEKSDALAAGLSGAFGGLFGSNAKRGLGLTSVGEGSQAIAQLTTSFQGILTGLESNASTLQSIYEQQAALAKGVKDTSPLSASQLNILGESGTSLSPFDILGVQNIGQLTSAFDAIAQFGVVLLAQGNTPQTVASSVNTYVQQLIDMASSVGFSTDEVTQLAISMGLSREAMAGFVETASAAAIAFEAQQEKAKAAAKAQEEAANAMAALELRATFTAYEFANLTEAAKKAAIEAAGFSDSISIAAAVLMSALVPADQPPGGLTPADLPPGAVMNPDGSITYYDSPADLGLDPNGKDASTIDQVLARLPRPITNIIYPPYGDPEAIALAVVNRQMQLAAIG